MPTWVDPVLTYKYRIRARSIVVYIVGESAQRGPSFPAFGLSLLLDIAVFLLILLSLQLGDALVLLVLVLQPGLGLHVGLRPHLTHQQGQFSYAHVGVVGLHFLENLGPEQQERRQGFLGGRGLRYEKWVRFCRILASTSLQNIRIRCALLVFVALS